MTCAEWFAAEIMESQQNMGFLNGLLRKNSSCLPDLNYVLIIVPYFPRYITISELSPQKNEHCPHKNKKINTPAR